LSFSTKSEQLDLLREVLAATDADAEEEQVTGVDWSTKKQKVHSTVFCCMRCICKRSPLLIGALTAHSVP